MIKLMTKEQVKEYVRQKQAEEQQTLADNGISSAWEGNNLVTIGGLDCDYQSYKEFCVAQMAKTSMLEYAHKTGWDLDELIGDLAQLNDDDSLWQEDVMNYFDGMEGE